MDLAGQGNIMGTLAAPLIQRVSSLPAAGRLECGEGLVSCVVLRRGVFRKGFSRRRGRERRKVLS